MKQVKEIERLWRKIIRNLHLYLGIVSGLVLFVVCLTGTIYTFRTEIEELLEPNKYRIQQIDETKQPISSLIGIVEQETKGKVGRVIVSDNQSRPYELNVKVGKEDKRGTNYLINPYTGEFLGSVKGPTSDFFMWIFKAHRWLLMDMDTGRPIVGIATLIFLFLCISGIALWIPKKIKGWNSFKPGFKIMWKARWKRINHDLHSTLGFYTVFFLIVMSVTGLTWSFEWYNNGLHRILTGEKPTKRGGHGNQASNQQEVKAAISYEDAIMLAQQHLGYTGKTIISKPQNGQYEITKYDKNRWNQDAADKVTLSAQTGEIVQVNLFSDLSLGEQISKQIKSIHMGTTFGMFSKIIYFISCLIATTLPITGVFIWWNKLKKSKKNHRKRKKKIEDLATV